MSRTKLLNFIHMMIFILQLRTNMGHKIPPKTIELSSHYEYPTPSDESSSNYNIAILSTNDIHGEFFPLKMSIPNSTETYESAGLQYLGSYIQAMRNDWEDRLLWLDGGDHFQGGIESRISNGTIITDFFNTMEVNASTIGNHEWDFGMDYLKNRMKEAKYPYIVANIKSKNNSLKEKIQEDDSSEFNEVNKLIKMHEDHINKKYNLHFLQNCNENSNHSINSSLLNFTNKNINKKNSSNSFINKKDHVFLPNQKRYKIFNVGKVRIGVIGLTTVTTPETTSEDLSSVTFEDYKTTIIETSKEIKNKTDAIILLTHVGLKCSKQSESEKYDLRIHNVNSTFTKCDEKEEMSKLLKEFENTSYFDAIISAHTHDISHQFVSGFPIMSNVNGGKYISVMYLNFKKNQRGLYELKKENILVEGPIPICSKVFMGTRRCEPLTEENIKNINQLGPLVNFTFHKTPITKHKKLDRIYKKWYKKYSSYVNDVVATTDNLLKIEHEKETSLGNLFSNFLINVTGADISIINVGTFRTEWSKGNITVADVFNMAPFENKIVTFTMTGKELKKTLKILMTSKYYGFYPVSGLKVTVFNDPEKIFIDARIFNGIKDSPIIDSKNYLIATTDFLAKGGDDFSIVRKWFEPKNLVTHGVIRDNLIKFLRKEKNIITKNYVDVYNPRLNILTNAKDLLKYLFMMGLTDKKGKNLKSLAKLRKKFEEMGEEDIIYAIKVYEKNFEFIELFYKAFIYLKKLYQYLFGSFK